MMPEEQLVQMIRYFAAPVCATFIDAWIESYPPTNIDGLVCKTAVTPVRKQWSTAVLH